MLILEVIEQVIEWNIIAAKVTFDLSVSTFVFVLLHLILYNFV